ncbi:IclR family transcriptional regulator [Bradyrhizobium sp. dw_411]|uniref:IclR family transcriptional regulator n=1 Tax=Bradyrhizobium sp. dw_411 TaxID=2720082 RepID=UPI001BCDB430|nr:IclR family transcriptional regulator [Bradyrhizobium sp. dw_411]
MIENRSGSRRAAKPVETTVLAVERALQAIEMLSGAADGLSLAEISRELIINKAIASRLLETLEHAGYVWRDNIAQRYHLTYRVSNLGLRQLQQSGLLGQCTSLLEDLAERTGELVRLSVVERGEKITWIYAVVGTRRTLRIDPNFNFEVSIHSHATGKAWLMTLKPERVAELLERDGMAALTRHTNVDTKVLRKELDAASRRGFATTYEENEIGVGAVAAPIMAPRLSGGTECVGVISVAAPTNRMTRAEIENCGPLAAEVANRLALMWPLDERAPVRLQRPA